MFLHEKNFDRQKLRIFTSDTTHVYVNYIITFDKDLSTRFLRFFGLIGVLIVGFQSERGCCIAGSQRIVLIKETDRI